MYFTCWSWASSPENSVIKLSCSTLTSNTVCMKVPLDGGDWHLQRTTSHILKEKALYSCYFVPLTVSLDCRVPLFCLWTNTFSRLTQSSFGEVNKSMLASFLSDIARAPTTLTGIQVTNPPCLITVYPVQPVIIVLVPNIFFVWCFLFGGVRVGKEGTLEQWCQVTY